MRERRRRKWEAPRRNARREIRTPMTPQRRWRPPRLRRTKMSTLLRREREGASSRPAEKDDRLERRRRRRRRNPKAAADGKRSGEAATNRGREKCCRKERIVDWNKRRRCELPIETRESTRKWTSLTSTREPHLAAFDGVVVVVDHLPWTRIRLDEERKRKKVTDDVDVADEDDDEDDDEARRRVSWIRLLPA